MSNKKINLRYLFIKGNFKFEESPFWVLANPGIDRIRAYFWSHLDYAKARDFGGATRLGRTWRKLAFPPNMRPGYDFFNFYMNDTHIKFIKSCRNSKRLCTDRALSEAFKKAFPEVDIEPGDQYDGRWLGQYALDLTGIKEFDN